MNSLNSVREENLSLYHEIVHSEFAKYTKMDVLFYLNGTICAFGIVANTLNLVIWCKYLRKSAVSKLLIGLSVNDLISLMCFLIFFSFVEQDKSSQSQRVFDRTELVIVTAIFHLYILFSNIAAWITVAIAFFRYTKIVHPLRGHINCTHRNAKIILIIVHICVPIISTPSFLFYEIRSKEEMNKTGYWIFYSRNEIYGSDTYHEVFLWFYGAIIKILSCMLVTFTTIRMIYVLRRRPSDALRRFGVKTGNRRTTYMLAVMLTLFVVFETPIGVASIASGFTSSKHHYFFFLSNVTAGLVLDTCSLLNSSCNIIVYIGISTKFREAIRDLFCKIRW